MNAVLPALFGLALSAAATCGSAGTLADVAVIDRNTGQTLPTFYHRGRLWVAGTPGNKYAVTVTNKSARRLMTVVSVDGINVVSGETAAPEQTGYVLDGGTHYAISGWRKSASEVAAFVFTALPDSYAARTDRPDNVGVIGVAVFREWSAPPQPTVSPHAGAQRRSPASADSAKAEAAANGAAAERADAAMPSSPASTSERSRALRDERIGTGHGEREVAPINFTQFRRASERPNELLTIYYDSHANLVARGIIRPAPLPAPHPFPAGMRFAPDPRG